MLPIDDTDWLEDFRITLSTREIGDFVAAVGETLVFTKSRLAVAAWLVVPGVAGGAVGGLLTGRAIWASWMSVLVYSSCAAGGLVVDPTTDAATSWPGHPVESDMYCSSSRFSSAPAGFSEDGSTRCGGRMSSAAGWGCSSACVRISGILTSIQIRISGLWQVCLGLASTVAATYIHRHTTDPSTLAAIAMSGGVAGAIFAAPMMTLLVRLWDNSRGFRQLGVLYLHNDAFLTKSVDCLTLALTLAPHDAELLGLRGIAWARLGEPVLAEADWQRVLELEPRNVAPLKNRGDMHLRREKSPRQSPYSSRRRRRTRSTARRTPVSASRSRRTAI